MLWRGEGSLPIQKVTGRRGNWSGYVSIQTLTRLPEWYFHFPTPSWILLKGTVTLAMALEYVARVGRRKLWGELCYKLSAYNVAWRRVLCLNTLSIGVWTGFGIYFGTPCTYPGHHINLWLWLIAQFTTCYE